MRAQSVNMLTWSILLTGLVACSSPTLTPENAPVETDSQRSTEPSSVAHSDTADPKDVSAILLDIAGAWRGDREFVLRKPTTVGVWVTGKDGSKGHTIMLTNKGATYELGAPARFDWGFELDENTLRLLHSGEMSAFTAMGQARADDPIPLNLRLPEDSADTATIRSYYLPLTAHLWNTSWPEVYAVNEAASRTVHGANAIPLVYEEGLRTAWYQLRPGMHINADPEDQTNPFNSAVIVTKGSFLGRLDATERLFQVGEMVMIPKGMTHEFYTEGEMEGEFIILMYGDGA